MKLGFGRILGAPADGTATDAEGDEPTRRNVPVRSTAPLARVLPPATVAAHDESRAIVQRAEQRAAELLARAEAEAASLRAHAADQGRGEAAASFAARSLSLAAREHAIDEHSTDRLVDLARLLAERLLGEALRLDPSRIAALARQALTEAQGARRIEIAAHPEDAALLAKELEVAGFEQAARILPDPTRSRGSLRIETELGSLDAELAPQLERLAKKLRSAMSHG
jgi:flagellar biosynthesis/type III secretory pathway protein FliH